MSNHYADWFRQAEADLRRAPNPLDKYYIPTRYPNGFESGARTDFYTSEEAQNAIQQAGAILEYCHLQID